MNDAAFIDKDYKLWVLLYQTRDAILQVRGPELGKNDLTPVEAGALFIIQLIGDKATPTMISKCMLRQHHSVTALLKRMVNKGLIVRTKIADRKNTWVASLTEKGEEAYAQSGIKDSLHEVMYILKENEKNQLEEYLTKLRDNAIRYTASIRAQVPPFP